MQIVMHPKEIDLFRCFLEESTNYFEYGVGGSTYLASQLVKGDIRGVESDKEWVEKVQAETKDNPRIEVRHVNVGPTTAWGTPKSAENSHLFPAYSKAIIDSGRDDFDLCLVDGRFRVACFLQAINHLPVGAIVAIHDYAARPEYHLIERYARPISSTFQLKFFVKRLDCDTDQLRRDLELYRLNWA